MGRQEAGDANRLRRMRKRHRVATALLAVAGAVTLAACGDDESTTTTIEENIENPAPAPETTAADTLDTSTTDTSATTTDTDTTTTDTTDTTGGG